MHLTIWFSVLLFNLILLYEEEGNDVEMAISENKLEAIEDNKKFTEV